jgi:hypothetical protein
MAAVEGGTHNFNSISIGGRGGVVSSFNAHRDSL